MTPGTLTRSHSAFVTFSAMPEDAKLFLLSISVKYLLFSIPGDLCVNLSSRHAAIMNRGSHRLPSSRCESMGAPAFMPGSAMGSVKSYAQICFADSVNEVSHGLPGSLIDWEG